MSMIAVMHHGGPQRSRFRWSKYYPTGRAARECSPRLQPLIGKAVLISGLQEREFSTLPR